MKDRFFSLYVAITLDHPFWTLALVASLVAFLAAFIPRFRVDASAESLALADDPALQYYRAVRARYGSDDYLIAAYIPRKDLFNPRELRRIGSLRDRLEGLEGVQSVTSFLDVPLLRSPPVTFEELQDGAPTLLAPDTDLRLARKELTTSPLYRNLLVGEDGRTAGIRVNLQRDARYDELRSKLNDLRQRALDRQLTPEESAKLEDVSRAFRRHGRERIRKERQWVSGVRQVVKQYRPFAKIRLAGIPLIVSDMIGFIRHDVRVFGLSVAGFILALLALVFRRTRWILLPSLLCAATGVAVAGYLGLVHWPVTVVSANFLPVLLIVTLSLCVHLMVRYEELQGRAAGGNHRSMVASTMRSKLAPSFYTALTTAVAFASLTVSDVGPVVEFGWIVVIGVGIGFLVVILAFPAALAPLATACPIPRRWDLAGQVTSWLGQIAIRRKMVLFAAYGVILALALAGMTRLSVENRFIDYFKDTTEISRGMMTIDRRLGGTTPLDVILDAPDKNKKSEAALGMTGDAQAGITGTSYWFNTFQLGTVKRIHDYLDDLPNIGKVLSLATGIRMLELVNGGSLGNFQLAIVYNELPDNVKKTLFKPYLSRSGDQIRFAVRVRETSKTLDRGALLNRIRTEMPEHFGLSPTQLHLTGMMVLYNNVLKSLFRSQLLTLGFVFAVIMALFAVSFRSFKLAALAIIPNLVAAAMVLGLIGGLGIPLDIMTITIAAITLGIGVDDTIHYTHRFVEEFAVDHDYRAAAARCHDAVGRALFYTSITVTAGFSIFTLSSFVPTVYFGLLTGFAMIAALLANLTLLPGMIVAIHPLGNEAQR